MATKISAAKLTELGNSINVHWGLLDDGVKPVAENGVVVASALRSVAEAQKFASSYKNFNDRYDALKEFAGDLTKQAREIVGDEQSAFATWGNGIIPIKEMPVISDIAKEIKAIHDAIVKAEKEPPADLDQFFRKLAGNLDIAAIKAHPNFLATAENTNGDILRVSVPEAVKIGCNALLNALTKAPNERIFDQIAMAKKSAKRERKTVFNNVGAYGGDLEDLEGGDDNIVLKAAAQILAYDREGAIPDAIKLIAKCAAAKDGNFSSDAGEILGILIGLEELKDKNRFNFNFNDERVKRLVQARCLSLTAIAAMDIRKKMKAAPRVTEGGVQAKVQEVVKDTKESVAAITPPVAPAAPTPAPATTATEVQPKKA